jgi:hypothetical protein
MWHRFVTGARLCNRRYRTGYKPVPHFFNSLLGGARCTRLLGVIFVVDFFFLKSPAFAENAIQILDRILILIRVDPDHAPLIKNKLEAATGRIENRDGHEDQILITHEDQVILLEDCAEVRDESFVVGIRTKSFSLRKPSRTLYACFIIPAPREG